MSLINDALKRAGTAPPPLPPESANVPPMQPASESRKMPLWPVIAVPLGLFLIFGLAGWFLWRGLEASRNKATSAMENVVARERPPAATPPVQDGTRAPSTEPKTQLPTAKSTRPLVQVSFPDAGNAPRAVANKPESSTPPASPPPATGSLNLVESRLVPVDPASALTNWPALKLQGIFYRPSNPSAVINAKSLFVGETVGPVKVVAIDRDNVTIEFKGQKRVLTLQ